MATIVEGDLPDSAATALMRAPRVAWDTETSGLDWRSDRLALCQVHAPDVGTWLVRVTDRRPSRLIDLLAAQTVTKVFHHAPFDLRFMRRAWGVRSSNVLCTKVASKLLTPSAPTGEHSLAPLVQRHLGVVLDKGAARVSDWSAPELTDAQVLYAARDVEFLLPLAQILESRLSAEGLDQIYLECCRFLPAQVEVAARGIDDVFAY